MRATALLLLAGAVLGVASLTVAQPPGQPGGKEKGKGGEKGGKGGKSATVEEMVARVMTYDANKDGKLTKEELTDSRLQSLFERADANKDGVVTKEELTSLLTKEAAAMGSGGFGGGPGGFGGFGPPQPGQVLPTFLLDQLKLTDSQKKELDALQKDVDTKLDRLFTEEQKAALKAMRERGPGGPGGFPPLPPSQ